MTQSANEVLVWALSRYRRPESLRRFQQKSYALLAALRSQHEMFRPLAIFGKHGISQLPNGWRHYQELVERHVRDEDHRTDYINLADDGQFKPESLSKIGFSVSFLSADRDNRELIPVEQGGVELRLQGSSAGDEPRASAVLRSTVDSETAVPSSETMRSLLRVLIAQWECTLGGVSLTNYEQALKSSGGASYAGQWLFYLPFPNLAKCLPGDIHHEPFANGILIQTTPHIPNASNPNDIAAGKRVRDVLDELGLINDATYAIEGWPPDNEETLYEQFITGAPADRKYTVHCVNFDGYDPDRKVLLYAKLFRRLRRHPKEWGFRGWDGPVLNEAKRQVRAATKAGGVPIEWHIGMEEPALAVRQLLADHTNITDQQLRVIYTPMT